MIIGSATQGQTKRRRVGPRLNQESDFIFRIESPAAYSNSRLTLLSIFLI
jgi:hypothetical protein